MNAFLFLPAVIEELVIQMSIYGNVKGQAWVSSGKGGEGDTSHSRTANCPDVFEPVGFSVRYPASREH